MPNQRSLGLGMIALVGLILLYYLWPYLIGGLAVIGGVQVYLVWRHHNGRRP
jgi:hypothetical protein